jgi:NAD(P)-dependent dehydrogenase (short-subunit alcohol dehydrogenase family)
LSTKLYITKNTSLLKNSLSRKLNNIKPLPIMATPTIFPVYTKVWHSEPYPAISPTKPELSARGKVVIITGGGTGIGASAAKAFAQAGASGIGIIGRREKALISSIADISAVSSTTKVSYAVADLTNKGATDAAFKSLSDSLGKIDILISNAGWMSTIAPITDSEDDDWWGSFEINIKGSFNAIRAFFPHAAPNATLLSVNTAMATLPPMPGFSAYASSKISSAKLHECLQAEHPELRVVNVQPGVIKTYLGDKSGFPAMDNRRF